MNLRLAPGYAAIVAGGDTQDDLLPLVGNAALVIAADSGAHFLGRHGLVPGVLLGDFDSCDPPVVERFRAARAEVVRLQRDKDKTDTEVALDLALDRGFNQAVVLGALGGERPEHSVANLSLLESYARLGLDVILASGGNCIFGLGGAGIPAARKRTFQGAEGDWVSLFPVTREARGVTTEGLRFPLSGATLRRGSTLGTSNEMTSDEASVSLTEGFMLAVVTARSRK